MLSSELIRQIKHIQLKAGHLVTNALSGEYSSAFKGLGMEFDKVREYAEGDDIRSIDWNVTARMNEPYVKVYREEREMTLMLMVDVSASLSFGTEQKFKNEVAAELAAVLAFLATKNNDKVGLIVFSDHVEEFIPPQKGKSHIWRIIRTVLTHKTKGKKTDLKCAFDFLAKLPSRRSLCFVLSDFQCEGYESSLNILSKRHELIFADISDAREQLIPACGIIDFVDAETGERITIDTHSKKVRDSFIEERVCDKKNLNKTLQKYRVDYLKVTTDQFIVNPLIKYFRKREKRIR